MSGPYISSCGTPVVLRGGLWNLNGAGIFFLKFLNKRIQSESGFWRAETFFENSIAPLVINWCVPYHRFEFDLTQVTLKASCFHFYHFGIKVHCLFWAFQGHGFQFAM